jgi:hypothetical protein
LLIEIQTKESVESAMETTDSGQFATKVSGLISDFNRAITGIRCDDSVHEQDQLHQNNFQGSLDRFKLWAGSLGAFHSPSDPRSLEHRLRKAPQVTSRLNELLTALSQNLHESKSTSSAVLKQLLSAYHSQSSPP